jgi:redox-sensing transcriptional repressor
MAHDGSELDGGRIPEATVARLPVYFRALVDLDRARTATVSSEELADMAGVNAAKVRKDLSYLGSYGTRGVGYDVPYLLFEMSRQLGLAERRSVVIAGAGNLGQALANYWGEGERGFPVVALVDVDAAKVGGAVSGIPVRHAEEMGAIVEDHPGCIGVLATPADVAQEVADQFVAAGVRSLLNFAPALITAASGVTVRHVDLALELQILSFYAQREPGRAAAS